ncbi:MAG: L-lactate dehydrogenase (quinone) large subunit LdhH [Peptococcales bacterium]|jgi:iron-sulfur cluster protein
MPIDYSFKARVEAALNNKGIRKALGKFGEEFPVSRAKVYEGIDFEALRKVVADVKSKGADNLEKLADQFEENLIKRGTKVHRAENGEDVYRIIKDIAKARNAKKVVKSKSMASEEIHLNKHLEDVLEMVETDLGEWIIQQINEKPSHMVMPAIHLSKEKCADIFSDALGYEVEVDIPLMVKLARKNLREDFLTADIGISGCNIAVAETGTMCIFTNEGNARLTATLPPVHIILLGYEKLVEKFDDIAPIAKALPKSATAQTLTSYVTMISGPAETLDANGNIVEKELHVILLDNGRRKMLNDPIFKEVGQCIRCGSCINVCPVYQLLSGHVYGHIYPGGIGALLTAFLDGFSESEKIQDLCISCGRCREFCPGDIDIPNLILELRKRVREEIPLEGMQNLILGSILPKKGLFQFGLRQASWATSLFTSEGKDGRKYIRKLPFGFGRLANWRSLPSFPAKPFRERIKSIKQNPIDKKGKIAFFGGCVIDYAYPEIGESLVRIANKLGYEVVYPDQGCCGAPAFYSGRHDVTATMAKQNLDQFAKDEYAFVVTACPTCTEVLKENWQNVLKNDSAAKEKAEKIAAKAIDAVKLIHNLTNGDPAMIKEVAALSEVSCPNKVKVTYHDSCHLNRSLGIKDEPREVISGIQDVEFVEMVDSDVCCGFGGSYSIKLPEISKVMLERKLSFIDETGADIVCVDCPGCLMQLRGGLDNKKSNVRALHTLELLDGKR